MTAAIFSGSSSTSKPRTRSTNFSRKCQMLVVFTAFFTSERTFPVANCSSTNSLNSALLLMPFNPALLATKSRSSRMIPGEGKSSQPPQPMTGLTVESHHWMEVFSDNEGELIRAIFGNSLKNCPSEKSSGLGSDEAGLAQPDPRQHNSQNENPYHKHDPVSL
jgi:hypothetical protein